MGHMHIHFPQLAFVQKKKKKKKDVWYCYILKKMFSKFQTNAPFSTASSSMGGRSSEVWGPRATPPLFSLTPFSCDLSCIPVLSSPPNSAYPFPVTPEFSPHQYVSAQGTPFSSIDSTCSSLEVINSDPLLLASPHPALPPCSPRGLPISPELQCRQLSQWRREWCSGEKEAPGIHGSH